MNVELPPIVYCDRCHHPNSIEDFYCADCGSRLPRARSSYGLTAYPSKTDRSDGRCMTEDDTTLHQDTSGGAAPIRKTPSIGEDLGHLLGFLVKIDLSFRLVALLLALLVISFWLYDLVFGQTITLIFFVASLVVLALAVRYKLKRKKGNDNPTRE